jgi:dTDP-glucose 4,6-dehydratase
MEFAREIVELTGSRSKIVCVPKPKDFEDDPKVRKPDIIKARTVLGWEPKVPRREGLALTLDYFKKRLA